MAGDKTEVNAKIPMKTMLWIAAIIFGGVGLTNGGTNALQSLSLRSQPVPVEVTSPQLKAVVEQNLAPVKDMIADHADEFAHPPAVREFSEIDARFERQDGKIDKIESNLAEATETINRLAGQVEMLVQLQLGLPR